jgi:hypothetical protein
MPSGVWGMSANPILSHNPEANRRVSTSARRVVGSRDTALRATVARCKGTSPTSHRYLGEARHPRFTWNMTFSIMASAKKR